MFPTSLPMAQNVSMSVPSLTTSTALPFGLQFPMTGPAGMALSSPALSAGPTSATITISPQVLQALLQQQQQQMIQPAGSPVCVTSMRVETPQQIQAKFALNCSCAACTSGNSTAHQVSASAPALASSPFFINSSSSTAFAPASSAAGMATSPTPASTAADASALPLQIPITLSLPGLSMLPMNYPMMNLPINFGMGVTPTPALVPSAPPTAPGEANKDPSQPADESMRGMRKRNTTKRYQCTECPKKFHQRSNLITHVRTHTGEKPFGCPYPDCGRRFSQSSNLRRHQRIHVREGGAPVPALASPSSASSPKHKLKPVAVKATVLSPVADSLSPVSSRSGSVSPTGSARSGSSSLASVSASSTSNFSTPQLPLSELSLGSSAHPSQRSSLTLHPSASSASSATLSLSTPAVQSASSSAAASAFSALMSPKGKSSPTGARKAPVSAPLLDSLLQATMTAAAEEGSVSRS